MGLIQLLGRVQLRQLVGIEDRVPLVDKGGLQKHFKCMVRDGRGLEAHHKRIFVCEEYPRGIVSDGRTISPRRSVSRILVKVITFAIAFILRPPFRSPFPLCPRRRRFRQGVAKSPPCV